MTPTTSPISEKDIAAPVCAWLQREGYTVREELVFTHPTQGQVSIDIAGVRAGETGDETIIVECKRSLTDALVEQCERWMGLANQIWCVHAPPKRYSSAYKVRKTRLVNAGIGIVVSDAMQSILVHRGIFQRGDHPSLVRAIHATPDCGPSAGSAGVKRMTDGRREWKDVIEYLKEMRVVFGTHPAAECRCPFSEIKRATRTPKTSDALVKAINRGGIPIDYSDSYPRLFWYVERREP